MTQRQDHVFARIVSDQFDSAALSSLAYGSALSALGATLLTFDSTTALWDLWLDWLGYLLLAGGLSLIGLVLLDRALVLPIEKREARQASADTLERILWIVGFRGTFSTLMGFSVTGVGVLLLVLGTSLQAVGVADGLRLNTSPKQSGLISALVGAAIMGVLTIFSAVMRRQREMFIFVPFKTDPVVGVKQRELPTTARTWQSKTLIGFAFFIAVFIGLLAFEQFPKPPPANVIVIPSAVLAVLAVVAWVGHRLTKRRRRRIAP